MTTVSVNVDVDVDLSDLETDDLVAELENRGFDGHGNQLALPGDLEDQRMAMLSALWDKDDARVIELLKTYLCDCLGRACI